MCADIASIRQIIEDAVRDQYLLRIDYHHFSRVVKPHELSADDNGRPVLVALQLTGPGQVFGLKRFLIEDVAGASFIEEQL